MIQLLRWELFKALHQSRTYFALAAILVIELIVFVIAQAQGKQIVSLLLSSLKDSFILKGDLMNGNLIIYVILNSLWFQLPLILIVIVSGYLCSEYKDNTLQANLLQGVRKRDFILAKYLLVIIFTLAIMLFLACSTIFLSYSFFGTGELVVYLGSLNFFDSANAMWRIIGSFSIGTISMLFFSVVSITIAIFFKEATKTWIVSALFLILTTMLSKVNLPINWLDNYSFIHLIDSWQLLFEYTINWEKITRNILLLISYTAIFMAVGIWRFQRKHS